MRRNGWAPWLMVLGHLACGGGSAPESPDAAGGDPDAASIPDAEVPVCAGEPAVVCALDDPNNYCDYYGGDGLQQAVVDAPVATPELPACIEIHAGTYTPSAAVDFTGDMIPNQPDHLSRALLFIDGKNLRMTVEGEATLTPGELRSDGVVTTETATVSIDGLDISGIAADDNCPQDAVERCAWGYVALAGGSLTLSNLACSGSWGPWATSGNLVLNGVDSTQTVWCGNDATIEIHGGGVADESGYGGLGLWGSCQAVAEGMSLSSTAGGTGITVREEATADLRGLSISGAADHALTVIDSSDVQMHNSLLLNSASTAVYVDHTPTLTFDNNTIVGATRGGLQLDQCDTDPVIRVVNNIIADIAVDDSSNFGYGILVACGGLETDTYANNLKFALARPNDSCGGQQVCDEPGAVEGDPLFVSESDYHVQVGSPAIDAGHADLSDPDGSASDIGAYGGPGACSLDDQLPGC